MRSEFLPGPIIPDSVVVGDLVGAGCNIVGPRVGATERERVGALVGTRVDICVGALVGARVDI